MPKVKLLCQYSWCQNRRKLIKEAKILQSSELYHFGVSAKTFASFTITKNEPKMLLKWTKRSRNCRNGNSLKRQKLAKIDKTWQKLTKIGKKLLLFVHYQCDESP